MQTLRLLPVAAAMALCASTFSTRADDTPAQAAARAALMQDMNETGNAETSNPPPPPFAPATPPPSAPPTNMQTNMPVVATPAPTTTVPAAAPGSAKNLVLPPVEQETIPTNQVTQYPVNPAPGTYTNSASTQSAAMAALPEQTSGNSAPSAPAVTPGVHEGPVPPPLPISGSQQQQLQALLQQYVANQITPAQYQAERAKIIAGQ
jgi:hypothetical protein